MRTSKAEDLTSAQLLKRLNFDLALLEAVATDMREHRDLPANEPLFMDEVLAYLLGDPKAMERAKSLLEDAA